jgi:hypothetical protein
MQTTKSQKRKSSNAGGSSMSSRNPSSIAHSSAPFPFGPVYLQ